MSVRITLSPATCSLYSQTLTQIGDCGPMCKSVLSTTVIKNLESEKIFGRLTSGKHACLCRVPNPTKSKLRSGMLNLHRIFYFEKAALVSDFPPFLSAQCKAHLPGMLLKMRLGAFGGTESSCSDCIRTRMQCSYVHCIPRLMFHPTKRHPETQTINARRHF